MVVTRPPGKSGGWSPKSILLKTKTWWLQPKEAATCFIMSKKHKPLSLPASLLKHVTMRSTCLRRESPPTSNGNARNPKPKEWEQRGNGDRGPNGRATRGTKGTCDRRQGLFQNFFKCNTNSNSAFQRLTEKSSPRFPWTLRGRHCTTNSQFADGRITHHSRHRQH